MTSLMLAPPTQGTNTSKGEEGTEVTAGQEARLSQTIRVPLRCEGGKGPGEGGGARKRRRARGQQVLLQVHDGHRLPAGTRPVGLKSVSKK